MYSFGAFYNATQGQNRKDEIEDWARERYPLVWEQLEQLGKYTTEDGVPQFNIVRDIKA